MFFCTGIMNWKNCFNNLKLLSWKTLLWQYATQIKLSSILYIFPWVIRLCPIANEKEKKTGSYVLQLSHFYKNEKHFSLFIEKSSELYIRPQSLNFIFGSDYFFNYFNDHKPTFSYFTKKMNVFRNFILHKIIWPDFEKPVLLLLKERTFLIFLVASSLKKIN